MKRKTDLFARTGRILKEAHPTDGKLSSILIGIYLFICLTIQAFIISMSISPDNTLIIMLIAVIVLIPIIIFISPKLIWAVQKLSINVTSVDMDAKQKACLFLKLFLIPFLFLFIFYLICQPGAFTFDSEQQYSQAMSQSNYNDWHPVLHTLLFFTVPLKLTGGKIGSIVLFQIIEFSLVLAYMAYTMAELGNKRFAVFSLLLVLLTPVTWRLAMCPLKDTGLAIVSLLLFCYGMKIYFSKGAWLSRGKLSVLKILAISICLSFATIFRHNAILLTIPFLIAVLVSIPRKQRVQLIAFFLVIMVLIKGPLYSFLNVEKPGAREIEILGLPLTVIGSVIKTDPDSLDEQTREFIYTLDSKEDWEEKYVVGDFNTIKMDGFDSGTVSKAGISKILFATLKCFIASPKQALYGAFKLTNIVYAIVGAPKIYFDIGINKKMGVSYKYPFLVRLYNKGSYIFGNIFWIFNNFIGIINFIVILTLFAKCQKRTKEDLIKFLFGISLLCHNFGTMLLLSSPSDYRFFYLSLPVFPVLLFIILSKSKMEKVEG